MITRNRAGMALAIVSSMERIKNTKQLHQAIDQYVLQDILDPIEIAKLCCERGALCSAVAVHCIC